MKAVVYEKYGSSDDAPERRCKLRGNGGGWSEAGCLGETCARGSCLVVNSAAGMPF